MSRGCPLTRGRPPVPSAFRRLFALASPTLFYFSRGVYYTAANSLGRLRLLKHATRCSTPRRANQELGTKNQPRKDRKRKMIEAFMRNGKWERTDRLDRLCWRLGPTFFSLNRRLDYFLHLLSLALSFSRNTRRTLSFMFAPQLPRHDPRQTHPRPRTCWKCHDTEPP